MSTAQRRSIKALGILVVVAGIGLGAHFLIRTLIALHS